MVLLKPSSLCFCPQQQQLCSSLPLVVFRQVTKSSLTSLCLILKSRFISTILSPQFIWCCRRLKAARGRVSSFLFLFWAPWWAAMKWLWRRLLMRYNWYEEASLWTIMRCRSCNLCWDCEGDTLAPSLVSACCVFCLSEPSVGSRDCSFWQLRLFLLHPGGLNFNPSVFAG